MKNKPELFEYLHFNYCRPSITFDTPLSVYNTIICIQYSFNASLPLLYLFILLLHHIPVHKRKQQFTDIAYHRQINNHPSPIPTYVYNLYEPYSSSTRLCSNRNNRQIGCNLLNLSLTSLDDRIRRQRSLLAIRLVSSFVLSHMACSDYTGCYRKLKLKPRDFIHQINGLKKTYGKYIYM